MSDSARVDSEGVWRELTVEPRTFVLTKIRIIQKLEVHKFSIQWKTLKKTVYGY